MRMVRVADLLDTGRHAGLTIAFEGEQLIVRGPKAAGDVAQALIARKAELREHLAAGPSFPTPASAKPPKPPKPPPAAWPDAETAGAADFCLLLAPDDLPPAPFEFGGPWRIVVDAGFFLSRLQADIRLGHHAPSNHCGALAADLRRLRAMLVTDHDPGPW